MADECHFTPDKYHSTHWMKKEDSIKKVSRFSHHSPIVVCTVISMKKGIVYNHYGGLSFDANDMVTVLQLVREAAGNKEKICLFWDNATMHKSKQVLEAAKRDDINIQLCFNLAYRPDINPCELVFRRVKL